MVNELALHFVWFVSAVLIYAEYCYFWQLKWYRADRFKDLLSTKQGKALIADPYTVVKILVAIILFAWWPGNSTQYSYAIFDIFLIDIVYTLFRKFKGQYRRPKFSLKAGLIIAVSIGLEYLTYVATRDWSLTLLVSSVRLIVLSFVVVGINAITNQIKRIYFRAAERKLKQYKKLIKIGITGSYGKTSVKELLAQVLSKDFKVAFTPKNINSDIGISRFILGKDFSDVDVAIFEIGAYNKGDIQLVCDIVHPTIGVLTAINQQHLSLFGSIENIQTAKYELLRAIPESGLSITNADNRLCMQYAKELESRVETFGGEPENNPTILVGEIKHKEGHLEVYYEVARQGKKEKLHVTPAVIGEHQAFNIAPCILVAQELGLSVEKIIDTLNSITQPEQSIKIYTFGKSIVIDDSYNSNPSGFKAALELLGTFPSKHHRVVITRGMHELGDQSSELHERIGNEISFFADELVIITPDFADDIKRGVLEKYQAAVKEIYDTTDLIAYIKNLENQEAVILFENRIPENVRELFLKKQGS